MIIRSEQAFGKGCDGCGQDVDMEFAAVAKGATGRHCEVLWLCESCATTWAGGEEHILGASAAREQINARPNEWADF